MGVQQPLIVRPLASNPDEYELIDGKGRLDALKPDEDVCVDVRAATDAESFRIAEATSKRTQRNAFENSVFFAAYVNTMERESGDKTARARVSKDAMISESELSQYLAINRLFEILKQQEPESMFPKTKLMGTNKLYELSKLAHHPDLLEFVHDVEENADDFTVEGIQEIVRSALSRASDGGLDTITIDDEEEGGIREMEEVARIKARLNSLSEKVSGLIQELNSALPEVTIGKFPKPDSASPETVNILEKMSVSLRRLLYYIKQLKAT